MSYELNQAPKAYAEQSAKWRKENPNIDLLSTEDYVQQPKYDGCLAIIDTVGQQILTRTGEVVLSMPHVLDACTVLFPGKVLFGEAWRFDAEFKVISGEFRRHSPQPQLLAILYDCVLHADWKAGFSPEPYSVRHAVLQEGRENPRQGILFTSTTPYCPSVQDYANALVALGGYDGAIVRRLAAPWSNGASKEGDVIKVKPTKSLDLKVVDWFPGKGKYIGAAGGIVVEYRGVRTEVGTGLTDKERGAAARGEFAGLIVEVEFMAINPTGKLREPRFKGIRHDKAQPDE